MTTSEFMSEAVRRILEEYEPQRYWFGVPEAKDRILSALWDDINLDYVSEHEQLYRGWAINKISKHLDQEARARMQSALNAALRKKLYGKPPEVNQMDQTVNLNKKAAAPNLAAKPQDTETTTHAWDERANVWVPIVKRASLEDQSQVDIQVGASVYVRPLNCTGTVIRQKGDSFRIQVANAVVTCWEQELEVRPA